MSKLHDSKKIIMKPIRVPMTHHFVDKNIPFENQKEQNNIYPISSFWFLSTWIPLPMKEVEKENVILEYQENKENNKENINNIEYHSIEQVYHYVSEWMKIWKSDEWSKTLLCEIQQSIYCLDCVKDDKDNKIGEEDNKIKEEDMPENIKEDMKCIKALYHSFQSIESIDSIQSIQSIESIDSIQSIDSIESIDSFHRLQKNVMSSSSSSSVYNYRWEIWFRLYQFAWYHFESPYVNNRKDKVPPLHSKLYFDQCIDQWYQHDKRRNRLEVPEWVLGFEKLLHLSYFQLRLSTCSLPFLLTKKIGLLSSSSDMDEYYLKEEKRGMRLLEYWQSNKNVFDSIPDVIRLSIIHNMWYYLPYLTETLPSIMMEPLVPFFPLQHPISKNKKYYTILNPSMACSSQNEILVNVRYSNYDVKEYQVLEAEGKVKTRNYLFFAQETAWGLEKIGKGYWLNAKYPRHPHALISGLEDIRLFWFQNQWWFTANCCDFIDHSNYPCVLLGKLKEKGDGEMESWNTESVVRLSCPFHESANEKNWVPWIFEEQLYIIYSFSPFVLYRLKDSDKKCFEKNVVECELVLEKDWNVNVPLFHTTFRGSGPLIPVSSEEFRTIVHEVVILEKKRFYYHRWIYLKVKKTEKDKIQNWEVFCSNPFVLENREAPIQYSLGLCLSPTIPERYYLSTSVMDADARFLVLSFETIEKEKKNKLFIVDNVELFLPWMENSDSCYKLNEKNKIPGISCMSKENEFDKIWKRFQEEGAWIFKKDLFRGTEIHLFPSEREIRYYHSASFPTTKYRHHRIQFQMRKEWTQPYLYTPWNCSIYPVESIKKCFEKISIIPSLFPVAPERQLMFYSPYAERRKHLYHPLLFSKEKRKEMWKDMVIYVICRIGTPRKKSPFDSIIQDYGLETVVRKLKKVNVYIFDKEEKEEKEEKDEKEEKEKEQAYLRALQEFYWECPEDNEVLILEENVNFHQQAKWPFSNFREFLSLLPPDYCSCHLSFTPQTKEAKDEKEDDNEFLRILPMTFEEEERMESLFLASVVSRKGIRQWMRSYHEKVHDKNMEHWLEKEEKDKVKNTENTENITDMYRTNIALFG